MAKTQFTYTIHIKIRPEQLWEAITKPDFSQQYWVAIPSDHVLEYHIFCQFIQIKQAAALTHCLQYL